MRFQDKVVIVTGGASGIGAATVSAFIKEGAKVVIADFSDRGQQFADELNHEKEQCAFFIRTDVSNEQNIKNMVQETVKQFGRIDILFANAGIAKDNQIASLSVADWQQTIAINLTGVFLSDKYVIEQMLAQGNGGAIVNCGSIHSHVGKEGVTAYAAAKGGVKLLTQTLAIDYAKKGIRINAICPGYIDTPLLKHIPPEKKQRLIELHPQGRLGRPEEVASAVLFLASDEASFVNGTTLLVDGGYIAQ